MEDTTIDGRVIDLHKSGGILIRDKKLLVTRARGKQFFVAPGGKLEAGETPENALVRELREELNVEADPSHFEKLDSYYAPAAGQEHKYLQMDVYFVAEWKGEIQPSSEIEELEWIDSAVLGKMPIGSIFEHDVIPELVHRGLIS